MPESHDKPDSDKAQTGLPADWALSRVTQAAPRPAATQPVAPASQPDPAPMAQAERVAPPPPAMGDPKVFGALGQWQERVAYQEPVRRASPAQTTRLHGAMAVDAVPVIHYAPPVNPTVAPIAELRQLQPQQQRAPEPQPPPQPQLQSRPQPEVQPVEPPRVVEPPPVAQQIAEAQAEPEAAAATSDKAKLAGLLSSLMFWRAATGLFVLIGVVLAVMLSSAGPSFEVGLAPIGQVNSPAPVFLAESGKTKLRVTPLADIEVPKENDLQLWMFQPQSERPISLGVLPAAGGVFTPPVAIVEGSRFVISLEPHGGATGGRITGNVLYGGMLANR